MSYQERGNGRAFRRERGGGRNGGESEGGDGGGGGAYRERKPLVWEQETVISRGKVVCIVQSAALDNGGRRFSFRVGKASQDNPDRPFPHMDIRDIQNVKEIIAELEMWVDTKRSALDQQR
jgi:hypothetical protein